MAAGENPKSGSTGRTKASEPLPRDSRFDAIGTEELRTMRSGLSDEESKVSYWRRLIQARIDLIDSKQTGSEPVEQLARLLADAKGSHQRVAALSVGPVDDVPPLPDLVELWRRVMDADEDGRLALLSDLQAAEEELSTYRKDLHERLDSVTTELIARYRQDPDLALLAVEERLGNN